MALTQPALPRAPLDPHQLGCRPNHGGFWRCKRCPPVIAEFYDPGGSERVFFLLHSVSCDKPVRDRATLTLRFARERAA